MNGQRLPQKKIDALLRYLAAGATYTEAAEWLGITRQTAARHAKAHGVHSTGRRSPDLKRLRHIRDARRRAAWGDGPALARRFGLAHRSSFAGMARYADLRLAAEDVR